ncbi:hypothetical protein QC761_0075400 [Podospora bellae-mahoneyi]|uniref:Uncharacterized protein n=1 Tax=Podospora bellae-mahoneyi TaxID=2093777 RepID=A0ABR0FC71_9PEZI|nr:hypothetical protein QC761_0075400 [Podospora bellae-mahoneyi]
MLSSFLMSIVWDWDQTAKSCRTCCQPRRADGNRKAGEQLALEKTTLVARLDLLSLFQASFTLDWTPLLITHCFGPTKSAAAEL